MATKPKPLADAETLRWAGFLGHTYVVIGDRGPGERGTRLETCDRKSAINAAINEYAGENPRVYNQYKAGKWREVRLPPAAATTGSVQR